MRQLRDAAGLGLAELAARAHYPYDIVRGAEAGPGLPDLPVLSAYVRGCGGTTEEWEERWRSLNRTPSVPLEGARSAGNSPASAAGASIRSATFDGDTPDPAVIMAALNRVAEGMAEPAPPEPGPPAAAGTWPDYPPEAPPTAPAPIAARNTPAPPVPPAPAANTPAADSQPAGWDPIRVSSAWPAIPSTPLRPAQPRPPAPAPGPGSAAPWESAPWADDPSDAVAGPPGQGSQAWPGAGAGTTSAWAADPGQPAAPRAGNMAPRPGAGPAHGAAPRPGGSRNAIVAAAVVVLVVLVVLLITLL